ncbi:MAG: site-specific integrase [Oscillospiraceae bacterium]|nr:site-specific integrase [Oscillospiraceae bacterium]
MAKIKRTAALVSTTEEVFSAFLSAAASRGVKDKTLNTYKQHFRSISKRLDTSIPIKDLSKSDLDDMIFQMRNSDLSPQSINSYTRTLKVFLSWCNEEGFSTLNIKIFKAAEAIKETYSDEELLKLLKKPLASCSFCELRNWAIVNFLMNSGCRAGTVRNILNQDVDIARRQIVFRHNKNGKVQFIPLCEVMVSVLKEYMSVRGGEPSDFLFCTEFGKQLTESGLHQAIETYNKSRDVDRTSIHAFRHSFARKYLVDCGGDAFTLQKLMGHSTLAMTKHYCNIYNSDIANAFDQRSPLSQMSRLRGSAIKK